MNVKKGIPAFFVLAVLMTGSPLALHAEGEKDWHEKKHEMMQEVIAGIGVTEEQLARIGEVKTAAWEQKKELKKQMTEKKIALKDELMKPEIDKASIDRLVTEISELKAARFRAHIDSVLAIRGILTQEQFADFQDKMESLKEKYGKD